MHIVPILFVALTHALVDEECTVWDPPTPDESTCSLARWSAGDPRLQRPEELKHPVLIEGALTGWSSLERWASKASFEATYGHLALRAHALVNFTLDLAQDGAGLRPAMSTSHVRDLLVGLGRGEKLFLFESIDKEHSLEPSLSADLGPVPAVSGLSFNDEKHVLSIGGRGAGLPPHKHTAAWLGMIVGRKRWVLLPPSALSGDEQLYLSTALQSPARWTEAHRARLRRDAGLLECVQQPGELILVPAAWWHGTDNLGDVVAVGRQAANLDAMAPKGPQAEGCALLTLKRSGLSARRGAWQMEPLSVRHVLGLAEALLGSGDPAEAGALLRERAAAMLEQARLGHVTAADAQQMVGRLGLWMERLPNWPGDELRDAKAAGGAAEASVDRLMAQYDATVKRIRGTWSALGAL